MARSGVFQISSFYGAPILCLFLGCAGAAQADDSGRAGFWTKGTQGAPDLKSAQARVTKNPKDADALNDLGFALRQNSNLADAEKYLKQAIEAKPNMSQAHCNLSVVYYDLGKIEQALLEAREAVRLDAKQAIYRVVLGNALAKSSDLKGAAEEYKAAVQIKPDYENAHYNLGRVLNESGQTSEARFALARALELDPKDERVLLLLDKMDKTGSIEPVKKGSGS